MFTHPSGGIEYLSVCRHDKHVCANAFQFSGDVAVPQGCRSYDLDAVIDGVFFNRRRRKQVTASAGLVRLRYNQSNVMSGFAYRPERGKSEIRGSHKNQAHQLSISSGDSIREALSV